MIGLPNRRSSSYRPPKTASKLCQKYGERTGPALNALTAVQSTNRVPGQYRSIVFPAVWGTEYWFTDHTQVAFVAPARSNTSCMCRHARTNSDGEFPGQYPDHGYQFPSISCIGRKNNGPPYARAPRANRRMYAS